MCCFWVISTEVAVDWKGFLVTNVWLSSLCVLQNFFLLVSARHLFPTIFQQEPCFMCWWRDIFLTACFLICFTYLTAFPDSLALFFLCLAMTFSSSPSHPFLLFLSLLGDFFSILLHLPWLFPSPQRLHVFVIVCQVQDIHWGWPTCVFAAALWIQKGRFGYRSYRSCCLLTTLYAWVTISSTGPLRELRENGKGILKRSALYP